MEVSKDGTTTNVYNAVMADIGGWIVKDNGRFLFLSDAEFHAQYTEFNPDKDSRPLLDFATHTITPPPMNNLTDRQKIAAYDDAMIRLNLLQMEAKAEAETETEDYTQGWENGREHAFSEAIALLEDYSFRPLPTFIERRAFLIGAFSALLPLLFAIILKTYFYE